jgi:uncharacterized membrane protein
MSETAPALTPAQIEKRNRDKLEKDIRNTRKVAMFCTLLSLLSGIWLMLLICATVAASVTGRDININNFFSLLSLISFAALVMARTSLMMEHTELVAKRKP